jgi:rare lipoprotein A
MRILVALALLLFCNPAAHAETVLASYYGAESGRQTASGETFRPEGLTAAHRSLPFGTRLQVCYHGCVVVRVTDRGPFVRGRSLDISTGAARRIGMLGAGVAHVSMERL